MPKIVQTGTDLHFCFYFFLNFLPVPDFFLDPGPLPITSIKAFEITSVSKPPFSRCRFRAGVGDRRRGTPQPGALVSPARNAPPPSFLAALSRPSLAAASAFAPGTPLPPSPPTPTPRSELCHQVSAPPRRHAMHLLTPRQSGRPSSARA